MTMVYRVKLLGVGGGAATARADERTLVANLHGGRRESETALLLWLVVPRCVWNNNGYRLIFDVFDHF